VTTFISDIAKARLRNRLWRPAGYAQDRSLLATVIALAVLVVAVVDLLISGLAITAGHFAFGLVVFAVARVCAGLSLTPRSLSDDDTPEATP
jgi:hypothetical protein